MLHRSSLCCWLDNVYIIMYIIFLTAKVAICHLDVIFLVVSARSWNHELQDNPEWHLLQVFLPIYESTHTDFFLNGFGLPLVVQRDWFLWSEKALVYYFVRLMWQHDRHGFIHTRYLLDYEQSWTMPWCAEGRMYLLSKEKPGCTGDMPWETCTGALGEDFPQSS